MAYSLDAALDTLLAVDAYKLDHRQQYPPGTEYVFSNLTARGTRIDGITHTVFFGMQAFLHDLNRRWQTFFDVPSEKLDEVLNRYADFVSKLVGSSPEDIWVEHLRELHSVGHLPLRIKAIAEGTLVPLRVPYLTVENTDPRFFWLTNYIETMLSAELWQPITSATMAWRARSLLDARAQESGADLSAVDYQGHDFSFRGMEGVTAAAASSAGHLISFKGTDTLPAIRFVEKFYGGCPSGDVVGASVNATEHSVMTAEGRDREFDVYSRLVDTYPRGVLSLVSDSYDLWNVLTDFLPRLKDKIMARDGKLVIRPDSGDPVKIVLGDPDAPKGSPQRRGVVDILAAEFGTTVNDKGFKQLDSHIGVVYGDGITYERADAITQGLIDKGYESATVTLGFGSFTYQYQTRDTFKMAVKATWIQVNGEGQDIFKDPITDDGSKKSATGRLAVNTWMSGLMHLIEHATPEQEENQRLTTVYENGEILSRWTFDDIRKALKTSSAVLERWNASHNPAEEWL